MDSDLLSIVKQYLKDIEAGKTGDDLAVYYAEGAEQIEYPNRVVPNGTTRDVNAIKESSIKGQKVMKSQTYDVKKSYVCGNTVIIEAIWTGTLAIPLGSIEAGGQMKAFFAQIYEFENGKIVRQRNYDCFEQF